MNLKIEISNSYKQDFKLVKKQGWNLEVVRSVISQLQTCENLDPKLKDHALIGDYANFRECHIESNLVVVYQRNSEILRLFRIGRHQDIFKGY